MRLAASASSAAAITPFSSITASSRRRAGEQSEQGSRGEVSSAPLLLRPSAPPPLCHSAPLLAFYRAVLFRQDQQDLSGCNWKWESGFFGSYRKVNLFSWNSWRFFTDYYWPRITRISTN